MENISIVDLYNKHTRKEATLLDAVKLFKWLRRLREHIQNNHDAVKKLYDHVESIISKHPSRKKITLITYQDVYGPSFNIFDDYEVKVHKSIFKLPFNDNINFGLSGSYWLTQSISLTDNRFGRSTKLFTDVNDDMLSINMKYNNDICSIM